MHNAFLVRLLARVERVGSFVMWGRVSWRPVASVCWSEQRGGETAENEEERKALRIVLVRWVLLDG